MNALLESRVFIDGKPASLWPNTGEETALAPTVARIVIPPPPASAIRELSPAALGQQQTSYQVLIDRIVHELDADAHFTSYAPRFWSAFTASPIFSCQ